MGPLNGLRVVEFGGIGPGPMCAMLLSDMGADVIRIDRPAPANLGIARPWKYDLLNRNRRSIAIDLKSERGQALAMRLVEGADMLIEGFRPGTMERLSLGPDDCLARNPRLAYGRMTGWGQSGPLSRTAGHDINYISISGVLHAIGRAGDAPVPPLNLVGDFGGGALFLAFGLLATVIETARSGKGQVIDASMAEGAAYLMTGFYGMNAYGGFSPERGTNITDTGAYFWEVYECKDGGYVSVGPIEDKFRAVLLRELGLDRHEPPLDHLPRDEAKGVMARVFRSRTRDEWTEKLAGTDACLAPVLAMSEAPSHPQNVARGTFVEVDGVIQPAPAPRFSRTHAARPTPPGRPGQDSVAILRDFGFDDSEIAGLRSSGAVHVARDA